MWKRLWNFQKPTKGLIWKLLTSIEINEVRTDHYLELIEGYGLFGVLFVWFLGEKKKKNLMSEVKVRLNQYIQGSWEILKIVSYL